MLPPPPVASTSRLAFITTTTTAPSSLRDHRQRSNDGEDAAYFPTDDASAPTPSEAAASESDDGASPARRTLPGLGPRGVSTSFRGAEPYRLYCSTERRNTIITLTDQNGNILHRVSAGMVGYRKSQRKGVEPAIRACYTMFDAIRANERKFFQKTGQTFTSCKLYIKGIGAGREGVQKAIMSAEGAQVKRAITEVIDTTRIKIGGVRPKKRMGECNVVGVLHGIANVLTCVRVSYSPNSPLSIRCTPGFCQLYFLPFVIPCSVLHRLLPISRSGMAEVLLCARRAR